MAKEYLKSKKIGFTETDISNDPKAAQWVYDHTGYMATPVLDIDGTVILGFDRPKIDAALRNNKHI
jgi:glutaredoxin